MWSEPRAKATGSVLCEGASSGWRRAVIWTSSPVQKGGTEEGKFGLEVIGRPPRMGCPPLYLKHGPGGGTESRVLHIPGNEGEAAERGMPDPGFMPRFNRKVGEWVPLRFKKLRPPNNSLLTFLRNTRRCDLC